VVALPFEQPQVRVCIGGVPVAGVVALQVEHVGYFAVARFEIVFAMNAAAGASYFAGLAAAPLTLELALDGAGFASLLTGRIDQVRLDLLRNVAQLRGRDLGGLLIDAELSESFANQTASQIAMTLAARFGLTANVTATEVPVGQYYELDHARSALGLHSRSTTAWNLLAALAQIEGFELSVVGTVLNFRSPQPGVPMFVTPQNFISICFDRVFALPQAVTVKSWSTRNKAVVAQAQGSGTGTVLIRPNLTAAQASQIAASRLAALSCHALVLEAEMPGDLMLMPGMQLQVAGTGSALDQPYTLLSVVRTLRGDEGFLQSVRAYGATG
jgi:hypothetical protein